MDEVVWFSGRKPKLALAIGSRIYSHKLTTCQEDFDDALMILDFDDELIAQIQVTRNHVSGYRGETVIYGEKGLIRIGCFKQKLLEVIVEAYGTREAKEPLAFRNFEMRRYELVCCREGKPFPITHLDGLRAQEIVAGAMSASIRKEDMARIDYLEVSRKG